MASLAWLNRSSPVEPTSPPTSDIPEILPSTEQLYNRPMKLPASPPTELSPETCTFCRCRSWITERRPVLPNRPVGRGISLNGLVPGQERVRLEIVCPFPSNTASNGRDSGSRGKVKLPIGSMSIPDMSRSASRRKVCPR